MHGPAPRRAFLAGAVLLSTLSLVPVGAFAGDLVVHVNGLRSTGGEALVALCDEATFTTRDCALNGRAAAGRDVTVRDVPPGTYAVQAIHDENGDGDLNRRFLLPTEGIGFSRDAPMRRGPPQFSDAAIRVGPEGGTIDLTMRYFQ